MHKINFKVDVPTHDPNFIPSFDRTIMLCLHDFAKNSDCFKNCLEIEGLAELKSIKIDYKKDRKTNLEDIHLVWLVLLT